MKLDAAILTALQNGSATEAELARVTKRKSIGTALHRLCRAGEIRDDDGVYSLRRVQHQKS